MATYKLTSKKTGKSYKVTPKKSKTKTVPKRKPRTPNKRDEYYKKYGKYHS